MKTDDRYLVRKPRPPREFKMNDEQFAKLLDGLWWIALWLFMLSMNTCNLPRAH